MKGECDKCGIAKLTYHVSVPDSDYEELCKKCCEEMEEIE